MLTESEKKKKEFDAEVSRLREIYAVHKDIVFKATWRKDRLEELMKRKIAKKWDQAKKAKMVRRLIAVSNELRQAQDIVEQAEYKVKQLDEQGIGV